MSNHLRVNDVRWIRFVQNGFPRVPLAISSDFLAAPALFPLFPGRSHAFRRVLDVDEAETTVPSRYNSSPMKMYQKRARTRFSPSRTCFLGDVPRIHDVSFVFCASCSTGTISSVTDTTTTTNAGPRGQTRRVRAKGFPYLLRRRVCAARQRAKNERKKKKLKKNRASYSKAWIPSCEKDDCKCSYI